MSVPPGSSRGTQSRLGTSQGQAGVGAALQTNLNVQARPVTSQGMKGMSSSYGNTDRMVKDKNYWITKLREKNSQLQSELEVLKAKRDTLERGQAGRAELEQKKADLQKAVTELRVDVGGFNNALDSINQGRDLPALEKSAAEAEKEATRLANAVDDAFRERQQKNKELDSIQEELAALDNEVDARVAREAPESMSDFQKYRTQLHELMVKVEPMQTELETLSRLAAEKTAKLKASAAKTAALQLRERKAELEKEKARMMDEIARSDNNMLKDERTRLYEQAQTDTRELEMKQKMVATKKAAIDQAKESLALVEKLLSEYRDDKAEQFRQLEAKDREMTEFMDRFESAKEKELQEIANAEEMIVDLLEHISRNVSAKEHMPDQKKLQAMVDDVRFKQQQAVLAENTQEHLLAEREIRLRELDKVKELDQRITEGLQQVGERMAQEEKELVVYRDLEALRKKYDSKRKAATARRVAAQAHKDALKARTQSQTTTELEALQSSLKADPLWQELHTLEEAIKNKKNVEFDLDDFISQKSVETNYAGVKADCLKNVGIINEKLKEVQFTKPRSTLGGLGL